MQRLFLTAAAALALSTGATLAASPDPSATPVAPAIQGPAAVGSYSGYYSGYVFPNEDLPTDKQYMARPTAPPPGHGVFSHVYLHLPNEGADSNG